MKWYPIGPDFNRDPRTLDPQRISRRNLWGAQGRINCIAFEPPDGTTTPATTYVVVRDEMQLAAFRRGAADRAWEPITDALRQADSNVDPSWIAADPHHPGTLYLGTFDDQGIYVSTTRGNSWGPKHAVGGRVRKVLVDPQPPPDPAHTVLYAATDAGVFRSGDSGSSWTPVLPGDVWSLCLRRDASGTPHFYAGVYQSGVWYADTDPLTPAAWTNLDASGIGLPAHTPGTSTTPESFNAVLVDCCAADPTRAYAWFVAPTSPTYPTPAETVGLYTTGSPRTAWTLANPLPSMDYMGSLDPLHPMQGFDNFVFAVAPNSPGDGAADVLFFGNIGNARSVDGGVTWKPVRQFFHNDMHGFAFYPDRHLPGTVPAFYIGCDGGLGRNARSADPAFAVETDLAADQYNAGATVFPASGTFENLDDGLRNNLVYVVGGEASGVAPPYLGCVDTGLSVKDGGLGWRSFGAGDSFELAVALGSDGVKVWEKVHLGDRKGVQVGTDQGGFGLTGGALAELVGEPSSVVMPTSPFVADGGGECVAGALVEETVTTTTAPVTAGDNVVVPVVSTAAIPEGQYLAIGLPPNRQAATATNVTATSFEVYKLYADKPAGAAVRLIRPAAVRIDQAGAARRISQRFASQVQALAVSSAATPPTLVCETGDRRLWRVDETLTLTGPATWEELATGRPAGADVASLAVAQDGGVFVLLLATVTVGSGDIAVTTPLFRIDAGDTTWVPLPCTGLPTTTFSDGSPQPFGRLVVDPVGTDLLYAIHGAEVYRVRRETPAGGAPIWVWSPVAEGLPGCWVSDLWIGDLADPAASARKVVLRAGVLGRGVFETDVTAGASEPAIDLYLRRHLLDQGWITALRDGLTDPYDPTRRVWHYQCADAKIDAPRSAPGGTFFQTDPEGTGVDFSTAATPAGPISNVLFDLLRDDNRVVPEATAVRLHVQVANRSLAAADGVQVWVLHTPVAAGVPALGSRTDGTTFPFWSQFHADGSIVPGLPANSWWKAVGPPVTLDGLDARHPGVASWSWTAPALAPGVPSHHCLGIFVHSAASPVGETTRTSLDLIAASNKQVGQKNLHVIEVPAAGSGGTSGTAAEGTSGSAGAALSPMAPITLWFHNSTAEPRRATFAFDLERLPTTIQAILQLPRLATERPLEESATGIERIEGPGCVGLLLARLGRFLQLLLRPLLRLLQGSAFLPQPPGLEPRRYVTRPGARVELPGVRLAPFEAVAVRLELRLTAPLAPRQAIAFDVQQIVGPAPDEQKERRVAGGCTFLLQAAVSGAPVLAKHPSQEEFGESERVDREDPNRYTPPWIRRIREATR